LEEGRERGGGEERVRERVGLRSRGKGVEEGWRERGRDRGRRGEMER
jgi:hypothetical protein